MNTATRSTVDKSTQPSGPGKRTIAFIMDICCVFLCSALLYSYVVPSIRKACYDLTPTITVYRERLVSTGLYAEKASNEEKEGEEKVYYPLNQLYDDPYQLQDEKKKEYIALLETGITGYYSNDAFPYVTYEDYEDLQEKDADVWEYRLSSNSFEMKESATLDQQLKFFLNACNQALNSLSRDTELAKYASKIQRTQMIELLVCISLMMLIFELLIPMINKKRQTIGKYVSAIAVVNPKDNLPITRWRYVVRFLILFLEVVSSIFTYGIPLFISFSVMCFNKKRYALHDFAVQSKTIPVEKIGEKELPDDIDESYLVEGK